SDVGHEVVCVDVDAAKVAALKRGEVPIFEPGLGEMIARNVRQSRISFTTDAAPAIEGADLIFIAVGTPPNEDGAADLQHVLNVAAKIGDTLSHYAVVVDKSTVPVGTAEKVRATIAERIQARGVDVSF